MKKAHNVHKTRNRHHRHEEGERDKSSGRKKKRDKSSGRNKKKVENNS